MKTELRIVATNASTITHSMESYQKVTDTDFTFKNKVDEYAIAAL